MLCTANAFFHTEMHPLPELCGELYLSRRYSVHDAPVKGAKPIAVLMKSYQNGHSPSNMVSRKYLKYTQHILTRKSTQRLLHALMAVEPQCPYAAIACWITN